MTLKRLYVDMDGVLVNFQSGIDKLMPHVAEQYVNRYDEVPHIFSVMDPIEGAIDAYKKLAERYDTYILSTAPWSNNSAPSSKLMWVKHYLGEVAYKRLILTHHKNLLMGDYLIDDRIKNGVDKFQGKHIHFGTELYPDWESVLKELI